MSYEINKLIVLNNKNKHSCSDESIHEKSLSQIFVSDAMM